MPPITVTEGPFPIPVGFDSWDHWRTDRRDGEKLPPAPIAPDDTHFCAICWGKGRILASARNGEGIIGMVDCGPCGGSGLVRRPQPGDDRAR